MKTYRTFLPKFKLVSEPTMVQKAKITSSNDGYEYIREDWEGVDIYETFKVLLLNRANNTIGIVNLSTGGTTGTVVDVKLLAKYVVESLACGVILFHNHPSGNLSPSTEDIEITKKIKVACNYFDVSVLDHIIVADQGYYSFADEGRL